MRRIAAKIAAYIAVQTNIAINTVRNRLVPAWYLPNGTMNAAEHRLENVSSSCERWSIWCGLLVIISIIAELVVAVLQPPYGSFLELSVATDAGIAIGIVGEVAFGMWNNRIQTELRRRSNKRLSEAVAEAGAAHERAGRAELAAEQLRARMAPRLVAPDQFRKLIAVASAFPQRAIDIFVVGDAQDSRPLATTISVALNLAQWRCVVREWSRPQGISGILLVTKEFNDPFTNEAAHSLVSAIQAIGLDCERQASWPGPWAELYGMMGEPEFNEHVAAPIRMIVAAKPQHKDFRPVMSSAR